MIIKDKNLRKEAGKLQPLKGTMSISPTLKLCVEGSGADRKLVLLRNGVKDCVAYPDVAVTGLTCETLVDCPVIIQIVDDIDSLNEFVNNINTTISSEVINMLVHGNHVNISATYDSENNEIILTGLGGGGGVTCEDIALCISTNPDTQTALVNWLQSIENITLNTNIIFTGDIVFSENEVSIVDATLNHVNTTINHDESIINSSFGTQTYTQETITYIESDIQYTDTNINHTNTTTTYDEDSVVNYDTDTQINNGTFNNSILNNVTINNPTFSGLGATLKRGPIVWSPAGVSHTIIDADSIATSVINGDNIVTGVPDGNYFVYDTSTPGQITVTSKDFLGNDISEDGIEFYYTITY